MRRRLWAYFQCCLICEREISALQRIANVNEAMRKPLMHSFGNALGYQYSKQTLEPPATAVPLGKGDL